jgi:hypothetical protein
MGRVARYKKVKSIDPFAKNGSWKSDIGDCATLKRVRRKSKTALKMKEQKTNKLQRRGKKRKDDVDDVVVGKRGGGSNGWGDDEGYDLPPEGGDDFDMNDIMGSVKKQKRNKSISLLLEDDAKKKISSPVSSYTKVSSSANNGNVTKKKKNNKVLPSEAKTNVSKKKQDNNLPYDGTMPITAKTSTREIIASCSSNSITSRKQNRSNNNIDDGTNMKQEKRKAFFEKKKMKKKHKRGGIDDSDDDNDNNNSNYHVNNGSPSNDIEKTTEINKKVAVKQQNYSDTIAARSVAFNVQVERPPTFTMLPRGANKLAKNQQTKMSVRRDRGGEGGGDDNGCDTEETVTTAQRIQKEKQDMEAMRERVMRQYAILRESRRK